jgi:predicted RNA-binding protein with PUA-like domain
MVAVSENNKPDECPAVKPASRKHWLVKFAPFRTNWSEIVRRGSFTLRGVRSSVARKHLSEMRQGDVVLFYHSQQELAVVGVMEVTREAYPDPTSADTQWLTCDFRPLETLSHPVPLDAIKADARLATLALVRQPRLAVMPVTQEEFSVIVGQSAK